MRTLRWKSSLVAAFLLATAPVYPAENLKINPHLNYSSDSVDGPLFTGTDLAAGVAPGKPNYIMIYGEGCFNSKRQARRTVSLYEKYRGRVNFVLVDLDQTHSPAQQKLIDRFFQGSIPDLVILDRTERPIHDQAGEQAANVLGGILDKSLK